MEIGEVSNKVVGKVLDANSSKVRLLVLDKISAGPLQPKPEPLGRMLRSNAHATSLNNPQNNFSCDYCYCWCMCTIIAFARCSIR